MMLVVSEASTGAQPQHSLVSAMHCLDRSRSICHTNDCSNFRRYVIVQLDNKKSVRLLHAAARVRLYHDIVQLDKKSVRLLQNLVHSSMSDESLEVLNSITTKLEETKAEL